VKVRRGTSETILGIRKVATVAQLSPKAPGFGAWAKKLAPFFDSLLPTRTNPNGWLATLHAALGRS
jgi:hypothetical protein